MSAQETKHQSRKVLVVMVLAVLVLLSAVNLKIIKDPLSKLIQRDLNFEGFVDEVQKGYLSDSFAYKNDFLNLNGLFARLTGRRVLNEVVRLNNGMLGQVIQKKATTAQANAIIDFSDYLSEQNIPFLYIQMPYKESLDGQDFPMELTSYANENAGGLVSRLTTAGVATLDCQRQ